MDKPIVAFDVTLKDVLGNKPAFFGWSSLLAGNRRSVPHPPLHRGAAEHRLQLAGSRRKGRARRSARTAKKLGLRPSGGVHVRLTGAVPMADEEFASIMDRGVLLAALMLSFMLLMLWLALRSVRMIAAILATIAIGLMITAAIGLLIYGKFNVLSVAFVVLFVGLGVDFGIQFCVRYRAERHRLGDLREALAYAGTRMGAGLTLAAIAAALAFYSFVPTNYAGLAQLGTIAGTGMILTYILSITVLPALLWISESARGSGGDRLRGAEAGGRLPHQQLPTRAVRRRDRAAASHSQLIPFTRFDSNPLDLRNPHSESVATALELMKNPDTSPNTVNILRPSRAAATALASAGFEAAAGFPRAHRRHVRSGSAGREAGRDPGCGWPSGHDVRPFLVAPPPGDGEMVASLKSTAASLRNAAAKGSGAAAPRTHAISRRHTRKVAAARPDVRARATAAFIPGLKTLLSELRAALHPVPVRFETLPQDLLRDWVSPQGDYRVQVFPSDPSNTTKAMRRFTHAVMVVAPDVTGTPVIIMESARTIIWAFVEAGAISFISIALILVLALRRVGDELMTLTPVLLSGTMTLATCVIFGIQLNFANIIAIPLSFGVGVAFDIYFVMWWRDGGRNLLQSPLTRAVLMSAGTTGAAFGTLSLSRHPGTASMGLLLIISLFWILVSMLVVLPALLHRVLPNEGLEQPQS